MSTKPWAVPPAGVGDDVVVLGVHPGTDGALEVDPGPVGRHVVAAPRRQAVPGGLLWDNETGIGRGKLTNEAAAFAGVLGTEIELLKARDPESKGMVERMNRFFRQRFMQGRQFTSPADFNTQLAAWLPIANVRHSRSRRAKPSDLIVADRAKMRALSPIAPETMFRNTVRLPRDYYVRVFTN